MPSVSWTDCSPSRIAWLSDHVVEFIMDHHSEREPTAGSVPGLPARPHCWSAKRAQRADRDRDIGATTHRDSIGARPDLAASVSVAHRMEGQGARTQRQAHRAIRHTPIRTPERRTRCFVVGTKPTTWPAVSCLPIPEVASPNRRSPCHQYGGSWCRRRL